MYSLEDRQRAVDLYVRYGCKSAVVIRELGYPSRMALRMWYREFLAGGGLAERVRKQRYDDGQRQAAVDHYLGHGCCLAYTVRVLGYPTTQALRSWIDELAPGRRVVRAGGAEVGVEEKIAAVADLCARRGPARDVAQAHGTDRDSLYRWKYELLGKGVVRMGSDADRRVAGDGDDLVERRDGLMAEVDALEKRAARLRMETDVLVAAAEVLKKTGASIWRR